MESENAENADAYRGLFLGAFFFKTKFVFIALNGRTPWSCASIMLSESTRSREGKCEAGHRGKGSAKGTEDAK
jgi:hypothetical protein